MASVAARGCQHTLCRVGNQEHDVLPLDGITKIGYRDSSLGYLTTGYMDRTSFWGYKIDPYPSHSAIAGDVVPNEPRAQRIDDPDLCIVQEVCVHAHGITTRIDCRTFTHIGNKDQCLNPEALDADLEERELLRLAAYVV